MEQIKVHDNFLSYDDLNTCIKIIKKGKWEYGQESSLDENNILSNQFFLMDLQDNEFFTGSLKEKIETTIKNVNDEMEKKISVFQVIIPE